MDTINYDVNFLKNGNFNYDDVKKLILYLINNYNYFEVDIIKDLNYKNYNFDFLENSKYKTDKITINKYNFDTIIDNNIIQDIYLNLNWFCKLHIYFGFYDHEINTNIAKIGFYYDINPINNVDFNDIFFYTGDLIFKAIDLANPDNANMGASTSPNTLEDIKSGKFGGQYVFINNNFINNELFIKHMKKLNYQKLSNGYIFIIEGYENIISRIVL